MPRRKFARVDYDLIRRDLPNELLGALVRLKWQYVEWYFLALDHDPERAGVDLAELERIPLSSRALHAITQRKKRDAQRNHLIDLGKRVGFTPEFDGDTASVYWPKWWELEGLKPRISHESATNERRTSGEHEQSRAELEQERERGGVFAPHARSESWSELPRDQELRVEKWLVKQRYEYRAEELGGLWEEFAEEVEDDGDSDRAGAFIRWMSRRVEPAMDKRGIRRNFSGDT